MRLQPAHLIPIFTALACLHGCGHAIQLPIQDAGDLGQQTDSGLDSGSPAQDADSGNADGGDGGSDGGHHNACVTANCGAEEVCCDASCGNANCIPKGHLCPLAECIPPDRTCGHGTCAEGQQCCRSTCSYCAPTGIICSVIECAPPPPTP